tara:strand:+ start:241 stop:615 length:375 start_codon:yes stop_codon:yes gene_type:complete
MAYRKFKGIEYPIPGVDTAIQMIRPGCRYDMKAGNGEFTFETWEHDSEPPTTEEIEKEIRREVDIYNYYLYERNREEQYPDLKDQLDMLFHDIKNGNLNNGRWIEAIQTVKDNNPKPNEPEPEL